MQRNNRKKRRRGRRRRRGREEHGVRLKHGESGVGVGKGGVNFCCCCGGGGEEEEGQSRHYKKNDKVFDSACADADLSLQLFLLLDVWHAIEVNVNVEVITTDVVCSDVQP